MLVQQLRLWGGLSCKMANLRPMSTAVSSFVLQHLACSWVQQIFNMWFSVTNSLTCCYFYFPINISCAYGLHTIPCNVKPYKKSQDDMKDYRHSINKSEKCTNIAKHPWLAPSINKLLRLHWCGSSRKDVRWRDMNVTSPKCWVLPNCTVLNETLKPFFYMQSICVHKKQNTLNLNWHCFNWNTRLQLNTCQLQIS
jgi:hypothetical protein